jgi:hypothetical protein
MIFHEEYKKECYEAFRYSLYVNMIMDNLNRNNSANVRSYMDAAIDDLQEEINQVIGEGEHTIHNARVTQLKAMYTAWYKLFELTDILEHELL